MFLNIMNLLYHIHGDGLPTLGFHIAGRSVATFTITRGYRKYGTPKLSIRSRNWLATEHCIRTSACSFRFSVHPLFASIFPPLVTLAMLKVFLIHAYDMHAFVIKVAHTITLTVLHT